MKEIEVHINIQELMKRSSLICYLRPADCNGRNDLTFLFFSFFLFFFFFFVVVVCLFVLMWK